MNQENPFHMPSTSSNPFGVPESFKKPNENEDHTYKSNNDQNQNSSNDATLHEERKSNPFSVPGRKYSESASTTGPSPTQIGSPITNTGIKTENRNESVNRHDHIDHPQNHSNPTLTLTRQEDVNHNSFTWGVPNKSAKTEQKPDHNDRNNETNQLSSKSSSPLNHKNKNDNSSSSQINDDSHTSSGTKVRSSEHSTPASPFRPVAPNLTTTSLTHDPRTESQQTDHDDHIHESETEKPASVNSIDSPNHEDRRNQRLQPIMVDTTKQKVSNNQSGISNPPSDSQANASSSGSSPVESLNGQSTRSSVSARRRKGNTSGVDYTGLLDNIKDPTEDEDDDDPFGINGFNEEWSDTPDGYSPLDNPVDSEVVDKEDAIDDDGDDDDPFGINGYLDDESDDNHRTIVASQNDNGRAGDFNGSDNETHGEEVSINLNKHNVKLEHDRSRIDVDALTARSHVYVSSNGETYSVDQSKLREGVQIGTVKRELNDFIHNPKIVDKAIVRKIQLLEYKKKKKIPFTPKIPKILDFLTRWRIGTTIQLARIAGWKDSNEQRLVKKLRVYDEVGFMRETDIYAGPKIWTAKEHGTELGFHPWLGGVKSSEINPMSQSHTFGLSSIASWLLCPGDNAPNILGLAPDEWNQVRSEIKNGTAYVLAEKEYRSVYSAIRTASKGLLPPEYRHGFIGYSGGQLNPVSGAWQEWALAYKNGDATLDESPELLACDPEFMGNNLWMWIIWGNSVWNPKTLEDRASMEEGIDLDDPEWSGRAGELRLRSEFRRYGYVDIEERLDYATNKPMINKELGDKFALWDHLPDMIIARRRTDDGYADPQSIAIELELSAKSNSDAYARTMAAYGSPLGQTLYRKVIWLVSSKTIADKIRAGANKVGMVLGEDYDIVPFVTSNKVAMIRKSFYSGADILPGKWSKRGIIEPCEFDRSIPLS